MEEEDKKDPASNFSSSAKQIISYSREEAIRLGNDFIGTEHLLLGILKHYSNVAVAILAHYTDNLAQIKNDLEFIVKEKKDSVVSLHSIPLSKQAEKVIRITVLEARNQNAKTVDSGCLLLAILRSRETNACQILDKYGLDYSKALSLYPIIQNPEKEANQKKEQNLEEETQVQKLLERIIQVSISGSIDGVLDIETESAEIANLLSSLSLDQGMMFGLFGQWGRGKTFFWKNVWSNLATKLNSPFYKAEFHAWKYQDTPASWAYLYEILANEYLKGHANTFPIFNNLSCFFKRIKLNLKRKGLSLINSFLLAIFFAFIWYLLIPLASKVELFLWVISSLGIIVFIKLTYLYFVFKPKAINILNQYSEKVSFKEYLGLQAEIQQEISTLLKVWIPENKIGKKRVLLFIDDIDRCNETKIIQIIDSLRIMLDEPEIAKRCVILAAIDERILKIAISTKYYDLVLKDFNGEPQKKINLTNLVREYMDKLFVGGFKLRSLNQAEKKEILQSLTRGKIHLSESEKEPIEKQSENIGKNDDAKSKMTSTTNVSPEINESTLPTDEVFELENFEYKYLQEVLDACGAITPRVIRIFYYRYLLAKRFLFIKVSQDSNLYNKWHNAGIDKSILPYLIMFFTVNANPEDINNSYLLWCNNSSSIEKENQSVFNLLGKQFTIDDATLKEILQIIEIIVPY